MVTSTFVHCSSLSLSDQLTLIDKLQLFKIQGRDKLGRKVLRIVGKFFPAQFVSKEALDKYFKEYVLKNLGDKPFSVVYFHSDVQNFTGISNFRSIYDFIPIDIIENYLEALYFVHPGLQARLVLAFFGRFLFTGGLCKKIKYVSRLDFLWDHMRRTEMEIPEFVRDHDEELEYRPMMMYDHSGAILVADSYSLPLYSMRCVA